MKSTPHTDRRFSKWFLAVSVLLSFFTFSAAANPSPVQVPVAQCTEWVYTAPKGVAHTRFYFRGTGAGPQFFTGVYNRHAVYHTQLCHIRFTSLKEPPLRTTRLFFRVKTCPASTDGEFTA